MTAQQIKEVYDLLRNVSLDDIRQGEPLWDLSFFSAGPCQGTPAPEAPRVRVFDPSTKTIFTVEG